MTIWPKVRIYFNRHGELPWSVDAGAGTEEFQAKHILLHHLTGCAVYAPGAGDNKTTPTAWIEVYDVWIDTGACDIISICAAPRCQGRPRRSARLPSARCCG